MTRFFFLLLLFCTVSFSSALGQSNRHALLVGVGNYPENSGWRNLSSVNDLTLIENTLMDQGFSSSNISTLTDRTASKSAILKAIQTQLTARVQPGDLAVFHFSGHGQQVCDDNGMNRMV